MWNHWLSSAPSYQVATMRESSVPGLSYLLRLSPTRSGGELVWRVALIDPDGGRRRGFTSLAELSAFLESAMADAGRAQAVSDSATSTDDGSSAEGAAPRGGVDGTT